MRVGGEGWGKADESARTGIFFPTAWVGVPQPAGELEHLNVLPFFCCSCSTLTTEQQKES